MDPPRLGRIHQVFRNLTDDRHSLARPRSVFVGSIETIEAAIIRIAVTLTVDRSLRKTDECNDSYRFSPPDNTGDTHYDYRVYYRQ